MSYFIFNGYNSGDDLIIRQPVIRPSWAREVNEIATGGVTKIIQLSRTFGNNTMTIPATVRDTTNIRDIYSKLRGYGQLVLSSAPDEYMNSVVNVLTPEAKSQHMAEIDIMFTLLPFAYAVEPTVTEITSGGVWVTDRGSVFSAPLITFTPTAEGDVTIYVNGEPFRITIPDDLIDRKIYIDCDAEITYYTDGNTIVSLNRLTCNDYPLLHGGENFINYSGNVENAEITVRERWY